MKRNIFRSKDVYIDIYCDDNNKKNDTRGAYLVLFKIFLFSLLMTMVLYHINLYIKSLNSFQGKRYLYYHDFCDINMFSNLTI